MHPRHSRRSLRLAIGALLLAPLLASCGFDLATDRVNDITAGTTNRDSAVDVINALVVAGQPDSGTLVGQLVNTSDSDPSTDGADVVLTGVTSGADDAAAEFEPLTIPLDGAAQLGEAGIRIRGTYEAGDVYDVTLTFDNGDEVEVAVPVVTQCGQYEDLDDAPGPTPGEAYSCEAEEAPAAH